MKITSTRVLATLWASLACLIMAESSLPGVGRESDQASRHQQSVALYAPQHDHLWNRLHRALFARTTPEGRTLGLDGVDPLLWPRTTHLLTEPSHREAIRLLDEFLSRRGDRQVRDPLRRAVLQHDLWAVFDWSAHPYGYHSGTEEHPTARRALQRRLVRAIRRLAPTTSDLQALPDNYAAAVKSRVFPSRYDPGHPERPFLPDDLFAPEGPWVCVGGPLDGHGPVALAHTRFHSGRSVFLVFLRLPGGRKATLAYLDRLNNVPSPWALHQREPGKTFRQELLALSPQLPQFPAGTQVALVRQMVLLADTGELAATPLTESVQFRTYRRIGAGMSERVEEVENSQSVVEFDLGRSDLFAGRAGGLHPVRADERAYVALQLLTGSEDPFESSAGERHSLVMPVLKTCAVCHSGSGIYSVNSFSRRFSGRPGQEVDLALWPRAVQQERQEVLLWKQQQYDWGLLQGLSTR